MIDIVIPSMVIHAIPIIIGWVILAMPFSLILTAACGIKPKHSLVLGLLISAVFFLLIFSLSVIFTPRYGLQLINISVGAP